MINSLDLSGCVGMMQDKKGDLSSTEVYHV